MARTSPTAAPVPRGGRPAPSFSHKATLKRRGVACHRRKKKLPLTAVNVLSTWLSLHGPETVPSADELQQLSSQTGFRPEKVTSCLEHIRTRYRSPLETYLIGSTEDKASSETYSEKEMERPRSDANLNWTFEKFPEAALEPSGFLCVTENPLAQGFLTTNDPLSDHSMLRSIDLMSWTPSPLGMDNYPPPLAFPPPPDPGSASSRRYGMVSEGLSVAKGAGLGMWILRGDYARMGRKGSASRCAFRQGMTMESWNSVTVYYYIYFINSY